VFENGSVYSDEIDVTVANLGASITGRIFDPLEGESVSVLLSSGHTTISPTTIDFAIHPIDRTIGSTAESHYDGILAPVFSSNVGFSTGEALVSWDGGGLSPVPAGDYLVRAVAYYASGETAVYADKPLPGVTANPIIRNDLLSGLGAAGPTDDTFNPYYGETLDISYTLSEPAWVILAYDDGAKSAMFPSTLFDEGAHVYSWDGRGTGMQGLGVEPEPGTLATVNVLIKAQETPSGLIALQNTGLRFSNVVQAVVGIHPLYGQVVEIEYEVTRDAQVEAHVYDTTQSEVGDLIAELLAPTVQTSGQVHTITWDGADSSGSIVDIEGTYSIELVARRPGASTYEGRLRRFVQVAH
jgi:hypothetical protein